MDSLLKVKYTLKFSTLYLLPFSRNRQNSICTSIRINLLLQNSIHTNTHIIILVFMYVYLDYYMNTIVDMQNEKDYLYHYNEFVYNQDFLKDL